MVHIFGKLILLISASAATLALLVRPSVVMYLLAFHLLLIGLLWLHKSLMELGLDNVRGQFYALMSLAFFLQGVGFALTEFKGGLSLTFAGLLAYILARFFFFAANVRYILHFQALGYRLNLARAGVVALLTVVLIVVVLLIPNVVQILKSMAPESLFIILNVGMAFIIFYNLLLLWGSEIAKRWAMGSVAIGTYLFADALFIGGVSPAYPIVLWILASTVMGLVATIRG